MFSWSVLVLVNDTGDKAARKLLRQLKAQPARPKQPEATKPKSPPSKEAPPSSTAPKPSEPTPVRAGDPLAALARKRKRRRRQGND